MNEFDFSEEKQMDETTVQDFEKLVDECFGLRNEYEEIDRKAKEKKAELEAVQERIMVLLEQFGKTKHAGRLGTIGVRVESYPTMPKDPTKKKAFFDYLKNKGDFENMITVNAQTLRSYYKAEKEQHEGDPTFSVPGLEPYERKKLTMRRQK